MNRIKCRIYSNPSEHAGLLEEREIVQHNNVENKLKYNSYSSQPLQINYANYQPLKLKKNKVYEKKKMIN